MNSSPFQARGNTVLLSVTTASSGVQVPSANTIGSTQYLVTNTGGVVAFITAQLTDVMAVYPDVGQPGNAFPILPGSSQTLSAPPNAYFSGFTISGTTTVFITPGEGA